MPASTITLPAHAKINLALSVGAPVPPKGYHPIASWFAPIGLHDTVRLTRLREGEVSRYTIRWAELGDGLPAPKPTPIDWPVEKDLAVRAHRMLEARVGRSLPVHLELIKRTPVGGGLGGGSSDAAAALIGLTRLFGLPLSHADLARESVALGADVAFFLDDTIPLTMGTPALGNTDDPGPPTSPRPALVTGFGERIERINAPAITGVLLLIPPFGCPTGPVYAAYDAGQTHKVDEARVCGLIASGAPGSGQPLDPARLFNDLAEPACVVEPRLRGVLDTLRGLSPHRVHVTGSGSTLFVIPDPAHPTTLADLAAKAEALAPELVVIPSMTL